VALAVLMPIVAGMGGNAGTQTMAVTVRALATNQLTSSNTRRMIFREFRIAASNGLALGPARRPRSLADLRPLGPRNGDRARHADQQPGRRPVGNPDPVTLDKANIDPAVSSAVFVTMMTDVMGFFSFLGLASLWGLHG
jgi:magnesium transporter